MIAKHQTEIINLKNDSQKAFNCKVSEYEDKIKLSESNNRKAVEEKDHLIKENTKQINILKKNVFNLEIKISNLKDENAEKYKKITILEAELCETNKNSNGVKSKYEILTEKLEKEFNNKNVIF